MTARTDATAALAAHAADAPRAGRDDMNVAAARAAIDTIACMIAGADDAAPRALARAVAPWPGGTAETVLAGSPAPAPWAALVNGAAAHALDYDDVQETAAAHASAVFVPALLALAQERDATGRRFVEGLAVSFDVLNALAAAMNYAHYARGWHTTVTLCAPAAAAGCGRLIGLDARRMQHAISAATSFAAGSKLQFGTDMKPAHAGLAAQAGILAALFAEQGLTAAPAVLEGPWSFADLYGGAGAPGFAAGLACLAGPPAIVDPGAWIKAYPCCASAHRPIDALFALRKAHRFGANDVTRVDAYVSEIVQRNLMYERPVTTPQARFSLNHCLAIAAHRDRIALDDFSAAAIADPALAGFRPRVHMHLDPGLPATIAPGSGAERCRLAVTLADGTTLEETVVWPFGHARRPLSADALRDKFTDCTRAALSPDAGARLFARLENIAAEQSLRGLLAVGPPPARHARSSPPATTPVTETGTREHHA